MRLAVIGNSHIGALKTGWHDIAADYPSHHIVFFGARGAALDALIVEDGRLVPGNADLAHAMAFTSGGRRCIDPAEFDAFLLHGMYAQPGFLTDAFYSQAVLDCVVGDLCHHSLSRRILDKLRCVTGKPIHVGHDPLVAAQPTGDDQDLAPYHRGIDFLNAAFYRHVPARLVPQPDRTIVNGCNTAMSFSTGSRALSVGSDLDDVEHASAEVLHMNAAFGQAWMADFLSIRD